VVTAIENGLRLSATQLGMTQTVFTDAWKKLRPVLERCDALICPTEAIPAPSVDYDELASLGRDEQGRLVSMDMTMQFNALKLPAISVLRAPRQEDCLPACRSWAAASTT
jgi:Asp-tRNA(Asn)/Glu-tRNA(Gln) amidotransferase A subunit family amidase